MVAILPLCLDHSFNAAKALLVKGVQLDFAIRSSLFSKIKKNHGYSSASTTVSGRLPSIPTLAVQKRASFSPFLSFWLEYSKLVDFLLENYTACKKLLSKVMVHNFTSLFVSCDCSSDV